MHASTRARDLATFQCFMARPGATPAGFPLVLLDLGSEHAALRLSSTFSQEIESGLGNLKRLARAGSTKSWLSCFQGSGLGMSGEAG